MRDEDSSGPKDFHVELSYLKAQMKTVREDIAELKASQKELTRFMYNIQGGKAWLFSLLAIAGTIGGFVSNLPKVFFGAH